MKTLKVLKIKLPLICMFVLFSLFTTGEAMATTYYVSPSGNDSNSGSINAPFKTIQKAADIVNPGDTVIVKDGVYTAPSGATYIFIVNNKNGSPDKWTTFKSENKYGAVLDGGTGDINSTFSAILSYNSSYIRYEGFEIKDTSWGGIVAANSNHLVYYGMKIHDIGRYQLPCDHPEVLQGHSAFGGTNSSYITIDSNIVHSVGRIPSGCKYDYNHDHMTYIHADYVTITNNTMYNQTAGWIIMIDGTKGWRVINNTFHGPNPEPQYYKGHVLIMADADDIEIKNNISHTPAASFIYFLWHSGNPNIIIKNNLVYGVSNLVIAEPYVATYVSENNIIGQDPLFVNIGNKDFHLLSDSPAIDKGLDASAYTTKDFDFDDIRHNINRPQGAAYDIGAYEYVGSNPPVVDTTPPAVPTALTATSVSSTQINLSWTASTDNVGVAGYKVYRNGTQIDTTPNTSYQDTRLSPSITYTYTVYAYDNAGNISAQSAQASATTNSASVVYLSDLSWISAINGYGPVEKDKSNGGMAAGDGKTITLNGTTYIKGLGVHAASDVQYNLAGKYSTFMSDIGVDDEVGTNGSVIFQVFADGVKLYDSGTMTGSAPTKQANVDITGKNTLQLVVANAGDGITSDHADWANARLAIAPLPDTTPPSTPTDLTATTISSSQINLSWSASTDNVGVTGYKVYRDGSLLSTVNSPQLTYQDTGLSPSTTYTYTVSAYDNAGNISAQSAQDSATTNSASVVYLSDLIWISAINGYGPVAKDKSNGGMAAGDGKTITLNGTTYAKGLGVHAASDVQYNLAGKYSTFMSDIGVDDEVGTNGSVIFQVFADGVKLYDSGTMTGSAPTKQANVDITGKNTLQLVVTDAGNGITSDHADWADARLAVAPLPDTTPPAAPVLN